MVKEFSSWVYTAIKLPIEKRLLWVQDILKGIISMSKVSKTDAEELIRSLENEKEYTRIGFSTNIQYIKSHLAKGDDEEDLENVFVHAWGSPKLLYAHKKLPILVITGGDLRINGTILSELSKNHGKIPRNIRGLTS